MKYRIVGKVDGIDYGVFESDTQEGAICEMLNDAGVPKDEQKVDNFYVEEME